MTALQDVRQPAPVRGVQSSWRGPAAQVTIALAGVIVVLAVLWAVFPGWFTHLDPIAVTPAEKLRPPSARHWLGTDQLGRDLYTRIVFGARASLAGSALAVLVGVAVGSLLGSVAGWLGGYPDATIMRATEVVLSIPGFLLAITLVVLLGFGVLQAALAVGITSSASFARLIRAEVLRARTSEYVQAAIAGGARSGTILRRHVIPNSFAPTVALITVQFGIAIIWIASLSFLGLGAQPPDPEWGRLVADGRNYMASRYWLTLYPALTIVAVVLASNYVAHWFSRRIHRDR
jgi:peptide/nickel transport system permease protein